ncbi:YjgN family protein [Pseudoalteromonas phenolica]|uniref:YjgN family protein n=1 Tax=Pseudoalteromonas phenolica TaxID=161398 RepID=UPI00384AE11E
MEEINLSAQSEQKTHQVLFTGNAKDYFGIWIVNILLSIVTLGIYSAWATVRTKQYFYGHTSIDGHRFNYLATPMQILKGRMIAFAIFALYAIVTTYSPAVALVFFVIWAAAIPWLINQSLRFNLRMTSHRNVRFGFKGGYLDALTHFVLLPIVGALTLYIAMPWVMKKIDTYIHNNIEYGNKALKVELSTGSYYGAVLRCIVVAIGFGVLSAIITGITGGFGNPESLGLTMVFISLGFNFLAISLLAGIYQSKIRNHIFANAQLDDVATFESKLDAVNYSLLLATNALAIIFTLGLAFPWTKVRKAKMLAAATTVTLSENAEQVMEVYRESQSSLAEEAANVFDVDISLT